MHLGTFVEFGQITCYDLGSYEWFWALLWNLGTFVELGQSMSYKLGRYDWIWALLWNSGRWRVIIWAAMIDLGTFVEFGQIMCYNLGRYDWKSKIEIESPKFWVSRNKVMSYKPVSFCLAVIQGVVCPKLTSLYLLLFIIVWKRIIYYSKDILFKRSDYSQLRL